MSLPMILIASSVVLHLHKSESPPRRSPVVSPPRDTYLDSLPPIKYEINCHDSFSFSLPSSRNSGHPCRVPFMSFLREARRGETSNRMTNMSHVYTRVQYVACSSSTIEPLFSTIHTCPSDLHLPFRILFRDIRSSCGTAPIINR